MAARRNLVEEVRLPAYRVMWECVAVVAGMRQPGAAAWSERKLTAGAHLMKMVTKVQLPCSLPIDHLGAERPVVAVGGVDVKAAARPAHRTGEKCGRMLSIPACPPHTAESLLRNVLLPEVHRDDCSGPCRHASPSGEKCTTRRARAV